MALHKSMAEALRLTRSGDLLEATAHIQEALGAGRSTSRPSPPFAEEADASVPQPMFLTASGWSGPEAAWRPAPQTGDIKEAGSFEERTFRCSQGQMAYWLYRPANAVQDAPLVVMLHGCTQSPQDFARGTGMNLLADELGFLVAYPAQSATANPQKCWNWFRPGDQQRDRGEPAQLAGITRQIIAENGVDPDRVYIAGLSAGGAAAAIMAAQYPDLYAAVGIHSGLACGAARDLPSALAAMQRGAAAPLGMRGQSFVPVIIIHGNRDATVNVANSGHIAAAATGAAADALEIRVEKGCSKSGRIYERTQSLNSTGAVMIERWTIEGLGHAWSGGQAAGSYTDPKGPDASRAMAEFFLAQSRSW